MRSRVAIVVAAVVAAIVVLLLLDGTEPVRAGAEIDRYVGVVADGSARSDIEATLEIRPIGTRDRLLVIRESRAGKPIFAYDPELSPPMHLVAVSRDLTTFVVLHPELDAAGDFTVVFNAPHAGSYLLYADATPQGQLGKRVFRFSFPIAIGEFSGAAPAIPKRDRPSRAIRPSSLVARVDGYVIKLAPISERFEPRATLNAKGQTAITATVRRGDNVPADFDSVDWGDLINTTTLAYSRVSAVSGDWLHRNRGRDTPGFARRRVRPLGPSHPVVIEPPPALQQDAKGTLVTERLNAGTYALGFRFHADGADHIATFFIDAR